MLHLRKTPNICSQKNPTKMYPLEERPTKRYPCCPYPYLLHLYPQHHLQKLLRQQFQIPHHPRRHHRYKKKGRYPLLYPTHHHQDLSRLPLRRLQEQPSYFFQRPIMNKMRNCAKFQLKSIRKVAVDNILKLTTTQVHKCSTLLSIWI